MPQIHPTAVIDPTADRTSYTWQSRQLRAMQDGLGRRTTLTYVTLADQSQRLQAVLDPLGTRMTLLYDSGNRAKAAAHRARSRSR